MERLEEDEETGAEVDTEGFKCKLIRFSDLAGKLVGHIFTQVNNLISQNMGKMINIYIRLFFTDFR